MPVPALVKCHYSEIAAEDRGHEVPDSARRGEAVEQHDGLARASPVSVVEPQTADVDPLFFWSILHPCVAPLNTKGTSDDSKRQVLPSSFFDSLSVALI